MSSKTMPIILTVELAQVGPLLQKLKNEVGIVSVDLDLAPRKALAPPSNAAAGPSTKFDFRKALIATLYARGPQTKDELMQILASFNHPANRYANTLSHLKHTGRAKLYGRTLKWDLSKKYRGFLDKQNGGRDVIDLPDKSNGVRRLPAPQTFQKKPPKPRYRDPNKTTGIDIIMELLRAKGGAPVQRSEMAKVFKDKGRSEKSINSQLWKLVKSKTIKASADHDGGYTLIAKH